MLLEEALFGCRSNLSVCIIEQARGTGLDVVQTVVFQDVAACAILSTMVHLASALNSTAARKLQVLHSSLPSA